MNGAVLVLEALTRREKPITIADLSASLGIPRRDVEAAIQHLRRASEGAVCSDKRGVWLARDREELRDMVSRLWSRIYEQMATARGLAELLERIDGQESLELDVAS